MPLKFEIQVDDKGNVAMNNLRKNVGKLGKQTKTFGDTFKAVFGAQVLLKGLSMAGQAVKNFIGQFDQVAKAGDVFDKMSHRVGASVEFLSEFGHTAQLAGTEISRLEPGIRRLVRNMKDADDGLATAKESFDELGIAVRGADGNTRDVESIIFEAADKISGMTDETRKLALAQEIFGRSGAEMIPILNQGSDAIRKQMEEAKELGIAWTTEGAAGSAAFVDAMTRLSGAFEGIKRRTILPLLTKLTPIIEAIAAKGFVFARVFKDVGSALSGIFAMKADVDALGSTMHGLAIIVQTLANAFVIVIAVGKTFYELCDSLAEILLAVVAGATSAAYAIKGIFDEKARRNAKYFRDAAVDALANVGDNAADIGNTWKTVWDTMGKLNETTKEFGNITADALKKAGAVASTPGAPGAPGITTQEAEMLKLANELKIEAIEDGISQERERLLDWFDEKSELIKGNNEAESNLLIVFNKKWLALEEKQKNADLKIQKEKMAARNQLVRGTISHLATIAQALGANKDIMKAFAIADITITTANAAMQAYLNALKAAPPGAGNILGAIAASLAVAAGAARIAMVTKARQGSRYTRAGEFIVGEEGPERIRLPEGSQIFSTGETEGTMERSINAGMSKTTSNIIIQGNIIGDEAYVRETILPLIEMEIAR